MHLIRFRLPTMRLGIVLALVASMALIAVACGGDDEDEATPEATVESTPIPTATPYARVPAPTIVASATAQSEATTAPEDVEYVVEPGDTLSAIAERFDSSVEAIMLRNDIDNAALIFVDQRLVIPEGSGPAEDATAAADEADDADADEADSSDGTGSQTYVVQAGDTAYGIALQFDITLEELAAANGTTVDGLTGLFVGDELIIP